MEASLFTYTAGIVAIGMLIWDTVEVGRNDATNIVNAVFGARVMKRKMAVRIAGLAVIIGAWASSPVMETARKGIFDPMAATITTNDALAIYLGVYLTDTVLLYSFSAFGMPISTTAGLVFSLLGGGLVLGGFDAVHWNKSGVVIVAIICSIISSGAFGFMVQRIFRGVIGKDCENQEKVKLHGPWIAGALLTGLGYFILIKGMKNVAFVKTIRSFTLDELGVPFVLLALWCVLSIIIWAVLQLGGEKFNRHLFSSLAVIGMIAIAIAFGQNDLANCASPGVASYMILRHGELAPEIDVPSWLLLISGLLLALGMTTRNAQRVTRAAVNTGSQGDIVRLYAPNWCIRIASLFAPKPQPEEALAPKPEIAPSKKLQHYDALRAAVITSVSASVIAFASGMGLPVSTTYVSFAAVVSTGWADKIFQRGDAKLKLGRAIWVVTCWFLSALLAALLTGFCSYMITVLGTIGIIVCLIINLTTRWFMKRKSDQQEERMQQEATERRQKLVGDSTQSEQMLFASETDSSEM
ncbi:MAG: inorganic phosphate transporter [Candidatus Omnitrophica bacterium]|nr:inorganic phosphate transporter [Candidatus Omnitrophota bacterium]